MDTAQIFAWARMFAGYVQTMPVTEAVRETIDLTKPCEICQAIQAVRQAERKNLPPATVPALQKLVLINQKPEAFCFTPPPRVWSTQRMMPHSDWIGNVPHPPPRAES